VPVIDSHVHLYAPETNLDPAGWAAARGEAHWAKLATRRRKDCRPVQGFPGADELLRAMDAAGIERAVLLGWYWQRPETCMEQNRFFAECIRAHPRRLAAFATLHPAAGLAAVRAEAGRVRDEGLIGLGELSPHSQGYAIDDPVFREILALAGEMNLPVNLHVTDPDGRAYPGRVATPLADFTQLASAFPRTTFILAHWGGLLPLRLPDEELPPNLFYDTAASPLEHTAAVWKEMTDAVGPDKVVFGSDFPLNLYPKLDAEPNLARFAAEARGALGGAALAAVLRGNLECLLGKGRPPSVFHA